MQKNPGIERFFTDVTGRGNREMLVVAGLGAASGVVLATLSTYTDALLALIGGAVLAFGAGAAWLAGVRLPARLIPTALIVLFPISALLVPPRRFTLSVFDVTMILLGLFELLRRVAMPGALAALRSFLTRSTFGWAFLLLVPVVAFSQFPALSFLSALTLFGDFVFFLYMARDLAQRDGMARVTTLLCFGILLLAFGSLLQRYAGLSLVIGQKNFNVLEGEGLHAILRTGGFFQDAQKAGQFYGCSIVFLGALLVRRRFAGWRINLLMAFTAAMAAYGLLLTASRAAILGTAAVSAILLLLANSWSMRARFALWLGGALIAATAALLPAGSLEGLVPQALLARLTYLDTSLAVREKIWFDTWDMFANHPVTGIGPASFQPYLVQTRPAVHAFYGIGSATRWGYVPDQPESGYLKILYEGGILGSAAALIIALDVLRRTWRIFRHSRQGKDPRTDALAALGLMAVLAFSSVTLYSLSDPRIAAMLLLALAIVWHHSSRLGTAQAPREHSPITVMPGAVAARRSGIL